MRYKVLDSFKALTAKGEMELQAGQVITLSNDNAFKLIETGKITSLERVAYKLYSDLLDSCFWLVADYEDLKALRAQGITKAIYTNNDITELKKLPKEDLKVIHRFKEAFPMSTIEKITSLVNQVN